MHIYNIMLAAGKGGIEQAALDYAEAFVMQNQRVTTWLNPRGWAANMLKRDVAYLPNFGAWDVFASFRLRRAMLRDAPDAIIAHGNRALSLALRAAKGICPVVGVTHNYSIAKRLGRADAAFCITRDLATVAAKHGAPENRVFLIPNMIRIPELPPRPTRRNPPATTPPTASAEAF